MDKNDIIEYVMTTPHNTNRAVLSSMLNQLTEGGGGGSSDFSTATVTFSGTNVVETVSLMPLVITAGSGVPFDTISSTQMLVEDTSYTIALYKGKAIIAVELAVEKDIIVSGSAESLGGDGTHNVYLITGDCTITILSAGGSGDLGSS